MNAGQAMIPLVTFRISDGADPECCPEGSYRIRPLPPSMMFLTSVETFFDSSEPIWR